MKDLVIHPSRCGKLLDFLPQQPQDPKSIFQREHFQKCLTQSSASIGTHYHIKRRKTLLLGCKATIKIETNLTGAFCPQMWSCLQSYLPKTMHLSHKYPASLHSTGNCCCQTRREHACLLPQGLSLPRTLRIHWLPPVQHCWKVALSKFAQNLWQGDPSLRHFPALL